MKLKIGNTTFNQKALRNVFWILFFIGIYVGVSIALKEDGKSTFSFPMFFPLILIIPKLVRDIKDEIQHERDSEDRL